MKAPTTRTTTGRALWIGVAAGLVVGLLYLLSACDYLDLKLLDLSFRLRGAQQPNPQVTWIAVSEDCLQPGQRRSPLPRDYLARVVAAAAQGHPRVILLDVLLDQIGPGGGG
jgi:CHASE2 domain-containing sensor protein